MPAQPYIPQYITVHLGRPDEPADNVTIPFPDYIKNVASSEIYPTWPEAALRANIYAQTSYALNRVYTEWYRSRGYDFDITNSTAYDQSFVNGRDIYENISDIVDEQFNSYIRRAGQIQPLQAIYCDGVEVANCGGLLQVGTVTLANQGLSPEDILRYYYGNDIEIVRDVPVALRTPSYPGYPLRRGDLSNDVLFLQLRLNRIARNYPAIPLSPTNGFFGQATENAVRAFQQTFGLTVDGIVGQATWYRIAYLYASVKRLADLDAEGLTLDEITGIYPGAPYPGERDQYIRLIQYFLAVVGEFYDTVPPVDITGVYDEATIAAVRDFQQQAGLTVDGILGIQTWRALYSAYRSIVDTGVLLSSGVRPFPGDPILLGERGEDVRVLQTYLRRIAQSISAVPSIEADGIYGPRTAAAVAAVQRLFGLPVTERVGPLEWEAITGLYTDLT